MKLNLRSGFGILLLLLVISSCSTANLISKETMVGLQPPETDMNVNQLRHDIATTIDPSGTYQTASSMEVVATDTWDSTIVRWLTPLDRNVQRFRAFLKLRHNGIEFTFLDGDQTGEIIGFDGQSYRYAGKRKQYEESAAISLYLDPLQRYLEWPCTLVNDPNLTLLGSRSINGTPYWIAYVTEGDTTRLDQHDQFLVYINKKRKTVDYIEFTMRKLMDSYRGVVHYKDFKEVQGVVMPFWIGIAGDLAEPDFDHFFTIESIQLHHTN